MANKESVDNLNKEMFSLNPDILINLYEIDFSIIQHSLEILQAQIGLTVSSDLIYRFCGMINGTNPIIWQGNSYQPLPIESEGFEQKSDGRMARPKLNIANPEGMFSRILRTNKDFVGCRVTRKRTYLKFLDEDNFQNRNLQDGVNPFGISDPEAHFPDDVYFISKKVNEDSTSIQLELTSIIEIENAYIPGRIIHGDFCSWSYRCDIGCKYKGGPVETAKNADLTLITNIDPSQLDVNTIQKWSIGVQYTRGDIVKIQYDAPDDKYKSAPHVFVCAKGHKGSTDYFPFFREDYWLKDECPKTIESCEKRFGDNLRFGGFPGVSRYDYTA